MTPNPRSLVHRRKRHVAKAVVVAAITATVGMFVYMATVTVALLALYGLIVVAFAVAWAVRELFEVKDQPPAAFTGSCPIREHTGDGAFVGRCEFPTYGGFCPRHGALEDYPNRDDREVRVQDRRRA